MDLHSLSRKDLQALCKKNRIPANLTNVAMADALQALTMVDGLEDLQKTSVPSTPGPHPQTPGRIDSVLEPPRTSRRTSTRARSSKNPVAAEDESKDLQSPAPLTRSRRGTTSKASSTARRLCKDEETKQDQQQSSDLKPALEGNSSSEILKTPTAAQDGRKRGTGVSVRRKTGNGNCEKEDEVGMTVSRTHCTRRSTRFSEKKSAPLSSSIQKNGASKKEVNIVELTVECEDVCLLRDDAKRGDEPDAGSVLVEENADDLPEIGDSLDKKLGASEGKKCESESQIAGGDEPNVSSFFSVNVVQEKTEEHPEVGDFVGKKVELESNDDRDPPIMDDCLIENSASKKEINTLEFSVECEDVFLTSDGAERGDEPDASFVEKNTDDLPEIGDSVDKKFDGSEGQKCDSDSPIAGGDEPNASSFFSEDLIQEKSEEQPKIGDLVGQNVELESNADRDLPNMNDCFIENSASKKEINIVELSVQSKDVCLISDDAKRGDELGPSSALVEENTDDLPEIEDSVDKKFGGSESNKCDLDSPVAGGESKAARDLISHQNQTFEVAETNPPSRLRQNGNGGERNMDLTSYQNPALGDSSSDVSSDQPNVDRTVVIEAAATCLPLQATSFERNQKTDNDADQSPFGSKLAPVSEKDVPDVSDSDPNSKDENQKLSDDADQSPFGSTVAPVDEKAAGADSYSGRSSMGKNQKTKDDVDQFPFDIAVAPVVEAAAAASDSDRSSIEENQKTNDADQSPFGCMDEKAVVAVSDPNRNSMDENQKLSDNADQSPFDSTLASVDEEADGAVSYSDRSSTDENQKTNGDVNQSPFHMAIPPVVEKAAAAVSDSDRSPIEKKQKTNDADQSPFDCMVAPVDENAASAVLDSGRISMEKDQKTNNDADRSPGKVAPMDENLNDAENLVQGPTESEYLNTIPTNSCFNSFDDESNDLDNFCRDMSKDINSGLQISTDPLSFKKDPLQQEVDHSTATSAEIPPKNSITAVGTELDFYGEILTGEQTLTSPLSLRCKTVAAPNSATPLKSRSRGPSEKKRRSPIRSSHEIVEDMAGKENRGTAATKREDEQRNVYMAMSLRQLKKLYKEKIISSKDEGKRSALQTLDENKKLLIKQHQ